MHINGAIHHGGQPESCSGMSGGIESGFTLLEMLITISVVVVLAALCLGSIGTMTNSANTAKCISNHRTVVNALLLYAGENGGQLPAYYRIVGQNGDFVTGWWDAAVQYLDAPKNVGIGYDYLRCPEANAEVSTTIGVNYAEVANKAPFGIEEAAIPGQSRLSQVSPSTVMTADIKNPAGHAWFLNPNQWPLTTDKDKDGTPDSREGNWFEPRHNQKAVCGLADGSVRAITLGEWGKNKKLWGP